MRRDRPGKKAKRVKGRTAVAATIALAAVVVLMGIQLAQGPPDSTTLILIGFATVLLFLRLAPAETDRFFRRMTNLKVAGVVEIALGTVAVAETVRPPGTEDENAAITRDGQDFQKTVDKLKEKIRFVHAITDLRHEIEEEDSFVEITYRLAGDQLLKADEAQFVLDLLSDRDLGLADLPSDALDEFLDATWSFASRFAFVVWDRYVRSELWKAGWAIADFHQSPGHRRDFLACWQGEWVVMAARVAEVPGPWPYPVTRKRLERRSFSFPLAGRCIVTPGIDRRATVVSDNGRGSKSEVKVLELPSLRERPNRAFTRNLWNDDEKRKYPRRRA